MDDFFRYIGRMDPFGLLVILVVLGLIFWWGMNIAKKASTAGKVWFWLLLSFLLFLSAPVRNYAIITPVLVAGFAYVFEIARPVRERRIAERKLSKNERTRRRHELKLAKASQTVISEKSKSFSLTAIIIQTVSGVGVWFLSDRVFEFGTTDATAAGVATAAILGVVFKVQS